MTALAAVRGPAIDFAALSPLIAVVAGSVVVLLAGLLRGPAVQRIVVPALTAASLLAAIGLTVWIWEPGDQRLVVERALSFDTLTLAVAVICLVSGLATVALATRSRAIAESGAGEFFSLVLASIAGMIVLAGASNLITLFIGLELLSIPLYVLCGSEVRRHGSLESGLKYLVIGSLGSATLLFGLALVYGATGSTDYGRIAAALGETIPATDPLALAGIALIAAGLAFKASVAPFHQWTPDVYQGAPTPVTAFMAVATKAAAFAVLLRFFFEAVIELQTEWGPALAVLAATTIVVGNVGAITQDSLKRMLAWSGVAQAGYLLAGVVVGTELGLEATVLYLAVYALMNLAAFAVVMAREPVSEHGDGIHALDGLGAAAPVLAVPMTVAMLSLAGFPGTAGLWGKFYLIRAAVEGQYEWLGVAIVVGSIISLVYYLRVVAVMWMTPGAVRSEAAPARRLRPAAGASPEADARARPEVAAVAVVCALATVVLGIVPAPLFEAAADVGRALGL